MPLVEALSFPDADVNGASWMDDRESFKCELGGNAMPDCSCELGLVSAILRNPELDFKAVGGVSHEMVYNVFTHNLAVLQAYLGVEDYAALQPLFDPLLALIYGHLTIGNGAFEEEAPGQYTFSGSGGYAISLIYALPTTVPISPETIDLANYSKLPEYLAWNGDADGDGFSNLDEYLASESTAEFVAGALDRTRCGSQVIGEGEGEEGESEGEEGEGEGEEGEGEEDPGEAPPLPAAKGFAIAFLLSVFLGGGILLHSAGTGRNGRRPAN
ncbi:MAG: hypothetical protein NTZ09_18420 [Candidatus Hydrogenedentes bacterium]|nr:hypothetical protein [Candidatus Hydrogenedentota bacterium]